MDSWGLGMLVAVNAAALAASATCVFGSWGGFLEAFRHAATPDRSSPAISEWHRSNRTNVKLGGWTAISLLVLFCEFLILNGLNWSA